MEEERKTKEMEEEIIDLRESIEVINTTIEGCQQILAQNVEKITEYETIFEEILKDKPQSRFADPGECIKTIKHELRLPKIKARRFDERRLYKVVQALVQLDEHLDALIAEIGTESMIRLFVRAVIEEKEDGLKAISKHFLFLNELKGNDEDAVGKGLTEAIQEAWLLGSPKIQLVIVVRYLIRKKFIDTERMVQAMDNDVSDEILELDKKYLAERKRKHEHEHERQC